MASGAVGAHPEHARHVASTHPCVVTAAGRMTWRGARWLIGGGTMEPPAGKWTRDLGHHAATPEPTQAS
jgi:hypothetical protein